MDELDRLFDILRKPTHAELFEIVIAADRASLFGMLSTADFTQLLRSYHWTVEEWHNLGRAK